MWEVAWQIWAVVFLFSLALWNVTEVSEARIQTVKRHSTIVIQFSGGGDVMDFYKGFKKNLRLGWHYVLDGPCASSCTMVLMDPELCVTRKAELRFHQAFHPTDHNSPAPVGTNMMLSTYPKGVRDWIDSKGGMPPGSPTGPLLSLMGEDLYRLVPLCSAEKMALVN